MVETWSHDPARIKRTNTTEREQNEWGGIAAAILERRRHKWSATSTCGYDTRSCGDPSTADVW